MSRSGGDSSTALLGCLRRLDARGARAFTYSYRPEDPLSEVSVSSRLAAVAGVAHVAARSFRGDLDTLLDRHVERAECRANLCLEIDAWDALREAPEGVLLTGDGAFGWDGVQDRGVAVQAPTAMFDPA